MSFSQFQDQVREHAQIGMDIEHYFEEKNIRFIFGAGNVGS